MIRNNLFIKCSNCGKILATISTYKEIEDTAKLNKNDASMSVFPVYCQDCYERSEII